MNIFKKAKYTVYRLSSAESNGVSDESIVEDESLVGAALDLAARTTELLKEAKEYVWMYCNNADDDDNGLLARIDDLLKEIEVK